MNNHIQVFDFKNKAICIALLVVSFAVNCKKKDENRRTENDALIQFYNVDVRKWRAEYIEEDSFLINGIIPPVSNISMVTKQIGKPQEVINNNIGNHLIHDRFPNSKMSCFIYNKNIVFDVLDSLVILRCILLENNNKIHYKNYVFDYKMTAKKLQEIFPESGKLLRGNGHGYDIISVPLSKDVTEVQKVVFFFRNGALDKILILPLIETKFMSLSFH